ncbi:TolC family protein [Methylicorpusculum oleiharenae]|uniref:TolC family protein n=1 Tax=Methylicorpusculum oleiharenae TaxID=1338687 RepID=UPI0038B3D924
MPDGFKSGIEAAEKNLSGATAKHLPQLALLLSHTYSDQGYDNRFQPPYNVSSANLQVNISLNEGGRVWMPPSKKRLPD